MSPGRPAGQHEGVKTLLLLRHAKSSWARSDLPDHDRPLAPRGVRAAGLMADHLREHDLRPALVVCSSAQRARQTLDALRDVLDEAAEVTIERRLYGADADELLERLRAVDPGIPSVLVIGHNPAMQDLAIGLAGPVGGDALSRLRTKFPTAALATLELASWDGLAPGGAHLASLVVPRELA
jgi:phosphohistidine phosphatase